MLIENADKSLLEHCKRNEQLLEESLLGFITLRDLFGYWFCYVLVVGSFESVDNR